MSKPILDFARGLSWVLLPFVVIALILFCGRAGFQASDVEGPKDAPQLWPAIEQMTLEIELQQENGLPVRDGILMVSAPQLARAVVSDQGVARVQLMKADKLVFLAYAPGFALYQGEHEVHADATVDAVFLQPIHRPDFSGGEPLVKLTRTVSLRDQQGDPLAALLVLARETGAVNSEPWVAISDAQGVATFPDATAADLHLDIYAAGLPPRLATRIGAIDVPADQQQTPLRLATARIEITGLPVGGLFEWKRLDLPQLLPLHRVDDSGTLRLGPVAPGTYRLEVANKLYEADFEEGLTRLDFRQLSAAVE